MKIDPIAPEQSAAQAAEAEPLSFQIVGYRRLEEPEKCENCKGKGTVGTGVATVDCEDCEGHGRLTVRTERHDFHASPDAPYGEYLEILTKAGDGRAMQRCYDYITAALVDDEERERFDEVLHSGLILNPMLLDLLTTSLIEAYADRPTSPRSASPNGGSPTARRSQGAAGSRGSATSPNGRRR